MDNDPLKLQPLARDGRRRLSRSSSTNACIRFGIWAATSEVGLIKAGKYDIFSATAEPADWRRIMFANTSLYKQTHNDAHKRRSTDITAPALTWHMAFVIPRRGLELRPHSEDLRYSQKQMRESLDKVIETLVRGLRAKGVPAEISPSIEDVAILFSKYIDQNTLLTISDQHGRLLDRHQDIFSGDERAINIVNLRWRFWELSISIHLRTNLFMVTVLAEPRNDDRPNRGGDDFVLSEQQGDHVFEVTNRRAFEAYTLTFWETFSRFLFGLDGIYALFSSDILNGVFLDLRGVVVPSARLDQPLQESARIRRNIDISGFSDEGSECIASYMLGTRALHITNLGAPSAKNHKSLDRTPICFMLCVDPHIGKQQLGRLIDRMHLIGTLRAAALLDLALLRIASDQLSQIDPLKKAAWEAIEQYGRFDISGDQARQALEDLHNKSNTITSEFLQSNAAGIGITFRIESSRYYASQFTENLSALRLCRVEGYQRYDDFILQRFGIIYEFIDRLGKRYDRAMNEMAALDQRFATVQTRNTGEIVAEIQRDGEAILIAILASYYLISIIDHFTKAPPGTERVVFSAVATGCVILAIIRYIRSKFRFEEINRFSYSSRFVTIALLIVFFVWRFVFA